MTLIIIVLVLTALIFQIRINHSEASATTITSTNDVSVFSDSSCNVPLTSISWGAITLNTSITQNFFLKNNGNSAYAIAEPSITNLVCKDKNGNVLSTDFSQYFNLTIDRSGAAILSNETLSAVLTLYVSKNLSPNVHSFSFNIVLNSNQLVSPADLNRDGAVNFDDIKCFEQGYVQYQQSGLCNQTYDLNHDGKINFRDLEIFIAYYLIATNSTT